MVILIGFESYVNADFGNLTVGANHTYTETDDGQDNNLLRRPENKASAFINYTPGRLSTRLSMNFIGKRNDVDRVTGLTVEKPGFTVWNASANFKLNENISFFGRVWNLNNKFYEPADGFRGLERQVMLGIELTN